MRLKKILEIEADNYDRINLFYEGSHWKVYERSALHWVRSVRGAAVKRRFYKIVNSEVAVLGVNVTMLDRYLHRSDLPVSVIERGNGRVILTAAKPFDEEGFQHWKSCLEPYIPKPARPIVIDANNVIFQELEKFNAVIANPMEALYFVRKLKLHLKILLA
jgi:hypothetical protein